MCVLRLPCYYMELNADIAPCIGAATSPLTVESSTAATPLVSSSCERDSHMVPVLSSVPISESGLTLATTQALLRTAIDSGLQSPKR
jgi:hypothetical protein